MVQIDSVGNPDHLPGRGCGCDPPDGPPLLLNTCTEIYPLSNGSRVCSPGTSGGLPTPGPTSHITPAESESGGVARLNDLGG